MKCLVIAVTARTVHTALKRMIVGSVFTVDDQIKARLEARAKIYSHHHCLPNSRPGIMIASFVPKPHASTTLAECQYFGELIVLTANIIFSKSFFIYAIPEIGVTPDVSRSSLASGH